MPNILIAESLNENSLSELIEKDRSLLFKNKNPDSYISDPEKKYYYNPDFSLDEIKNNIHLYDAVIVRPKIISKEVIDNADNLKLIIRGGTGVNTIDIEAARSRGIIVENTPGLNAIATAEFTFNFLFDLVARRNSFLSYIDIMEQEDDDNILRMKPEPYAGFELYGKSIGIVGLGAIGQAVAKRAKAFGMEVFAFSKSFSNEYTDKRVEELGIKQCKSLDELLKISDIISLHTPLTNETKDIINKDNIANIKDGAYIINTARPQLIASDSIEYAMKNNSLGGIAIDGDPDLILPFIHIAKSNPSVPCILTHHIADNTEEAQIAITNSCIKQVKEFFDNNLKINVVS